MRQLFILRGCPGAGKTSLIRELGVERHALGYDQFRRLFSSDYYTLDGDTSLSIRGGQRIVAITHEALAARLNQGDLLFWDATSLDQQGLDELIDLATRYGYSIYIIDAQRGLTWEEIVARNAQRGPDKLALDRLRTLFEKGAQSAVTPENVPVLTAAQAREQVPQLLRLGDEPTNFDQFERVIIVGDIQSCPGALVKAREAFGGFGDPQTAWIFAGDLFDRGPDAAQVVELLHPLPADPSNPNVFLIEGNHDTNMRRVVNRIVTTTKKHAPTWESLAQIRAGGFEDSHVQDLLGRMRPWLYFTFRGERYIVTHGGIDFSHEPAVDLSLGAEPIHPSRHEVREYIYGTSDRARTYIGETDYWVDTATFAHPQIIQFHGHRNLKHPQPPRPVTANGRVFDLEGRVDRGGAMRVAQILGDGEIRTFEFVDDEAVAAFARAQAGAGAQDGAGDE